MIKIPENTTEFLYWVKEKTEAFWSQDPQLNQEYFEESEWIRGAKWVGLEDLQIDQIEEKYSIKFTPDHRDFLRVLHTIDRMIIITNPDHFPEGTEVFYKEVSFFYDWLTDEQQIRDMLYWPYRTILQDIKGVKTAWLKSWGNRPQSDQEREEIFARWYKQAPPLIPLDGHRFLVSEPLQAGNPVLSVWGSDTIVYAWDLRSFLIDVFEFELNLLEQVFNEEDQVWQTESKKESQDIRDQGYAANRQIPFWGEVIAYSNSGWTYTPGNKK